MDVIDNYKEYCFCAGEYYVNGRWKQNYFIFHNPSTELTPETFPGDELIFIIGNHDLQTCFSIVKFFNNSESHCQSIIDCIICRMYKYFKLYYDEYHNCLITANNRLSTDLLKDKYISMAKFYKKAVFIIISEAHVIYNRKLIYVKEDKTLINEIANNVLYNPMCNIIN